jgi:hypothetical protein
LAEDEPAFREADMALGAALGAEGLLRIPPDQPERLFTGEASAAKGEYRRLLQDWHPDHSTDPRARDVLERIVSLYRTAQERFAAGEWRVPGMVDLRRDDGGRIRIRSRKAHAFATGTLHVGDTVASWLMPGEDADLHAAALRTIAGLGYPDERTRESVSRYLPEVRGHGRTDKGLLISVRKRPDEVLLADLVAHLGGRLPAVHAAWVVNRLLNIACYLGVSRRMHGAIGPETVFVSPPKHSAALLGGWGYAAPFGAPLVALPPLTHATMPPRVLAARVADPRVDLEMVRATGRIVLGDASGASLLHDDALPRPLALWLNQPAGRSATGDYEAWQRVLDESFGPRAFVELRASAAEIYPEST